ncbi:hypothetical protein PGT21_018922 [Puccinia graminis f. sp. tritici]|uniref:SAM domain-containing protein n=1 Tax=Puccinia graminis f. sp. tritici TaxID=56615 RepID=A0A5B0QIY8_PUCGR|nr:hypothetical protein PGT21_018922 [Puccinia graminis f. sp. tritici]
MRRWFIILHWVFHLPFSTLRISTVPLELKLGISQEDDAKSFDLNEFPEEDFHSYRSQPITSCPVLERFDGSNNESSEQEMIAQARHSFHQTISFPVIKSEDRGDQEPLTHYEIPRSECSTTSSLRRKNNALFINQRAKRPKQETFPIGYASTKKETPTSNRRAKNTLAKGGKRFLLESEKSLAQRNRARGASQSNSKTEIMYVKGEPVADQDTKDNIIKLELVDHFGLEESQKKGVLFNVNDWKFITEERQDLIENEYPGKFFEFLNNLKGDDQDASVPEKRASFFLTRESAMGFLKKYLSSRTEFEDESGIKKDQKKELVMRTLLRISDRKLKLADNRFYADELLGRIKDRLKLEHDSCLDPIQVQLQPNRESLRSRLAEDLKKKKNQSESLEDYTPCHESKTIGILRGSLVSPAHDLDVTHAPPAHRAGWSVPVGATSRIPPPTSPSTHPSNRPAPAKNLPIQSSDRKIRRSFNLHQSLLTKMDLDVIDYLLEPSETQESTLGPSQQTPYQGLFFEETQPPETQIHRLDALSPPDPDDELCKSPRTGARRGPMKRSKKAAATSASNGNGSLLISLEYCFWVNNYNPQIPEKQRAASNCKSDWGKVASNKDALPTLKTNLLERKWEELQEQVLGLIGQDKKNLGLYVQQVKAGLKWLLYISGSHTFPFKRQYYCSSDEELQCFAEEVARKPLQKVFIRVEMDDPTAKEKLELAKQKSEKEAQKVENILAIAVGSESERLPLQREEARQKQNRQSDVRGDPVAPFVIKLRQHLEKESNSKPSEVIFWPHKDIPNLVLRVTHDRLWAWAHVLLAKSQGNVTEANRHVDLNIPPTCSTFKWEKRPGITPVNRGAAPVNSNPSGTRRASEQMPASASAHHSHSRRSLGPLDFSTTRSTSSNTPSATRSTSSYAPSPNSLSPANVSQSLDPPDLDFEGPSIDFDPPRLDIKGTSIDIERDDTEITSRSSSVEIEYMNANEVSMKSSSPYSTPHDLNNHRRKMVRSPSGDPIAAFSNMSVRQTKPSPSPTRKICTNRMLPLLPAGKKLSLNDFLVHCNIDIDDAMCQILFKGHDVKHWSFFRGKSDEHLMRIGFTRGLATHLSNGASELEHTHVQREFGTPEI